MKKQDYIEEYDFSDPKKDYSDLKISRALARFDELLNNHIAENIEYSSKEIASFLFVRAYCESFAARHKGRVRTHITADTRSGDISIYIPMLFFSKKDYADLKIVMPHVNTIAVFPHNKELCIKTAVDLCPNVESPFSIATHGYFSALNEFDQTQKNK